LHEQALAISKQIGDRVAEAQDLCNLASAFAVASQPHRVIENCEQSLSLAREIGLREVEAEDLRLLGVAHRDLGDKVVAHDYFRRSLELARELSYPTAQQAVLDSLAKAPE